VQLNESTWKIHGSALLEDISEALGVMLTCDEYDTFNGLIFDALGTIPEDGTNAEVQVKNLQIKITEIKRHQVETALVQVLPAEQDVIE